MATLAMNYYLKALNAYPYDMEEALESLEYALSYDEAYAPAHQLMGVLYYEQLGNFEQAFYHFDQALIHDVSYARTYCSYAEALIAYGQFPRAEKLLEHAATIPGVCSGCLWGARAELYEAQGKFKRARKCLKSGLNVSLHNGERSALRQHLTRVEEKLNEKKKTKKG